MINPATWDELHVRVDKVLEVLAGNHEALLYAFYWRLTPQMHTHWCTRHDGEIPLNAEDIEVLNKILVEAARRKMTDV